MTTSTLRTVRGQLLLVTRKAVKNMYLRIRPADGALCVTAPLGLPDERILRFVESRQNWIRQRQDRLQAQPGEATGLDGEIVLLWGRNLTLRRIDGTGPVTVREDTLILPLLPSATEQAAAVKLQKSLLAELTAALPDIIRSAEATTGLHAQSWQLRKMKSRWGSCTIGSARIHLNTQLVHYPPECLLQVTIHELIHLTEPGHNARFYALMDRAMPDWRQADRLLKGK